MQSVLHALLIPLESLQHLATTAGKILGMAVLVLGPSALIAHFSSERK